MNAPVTKGWCPTLLTPMESGDGYLVRVKPSAAQISADAAAAIAASAARFGNGIIDITNRGNLQIRGLTPETAEAFAGDILRLGLANADPRAEAVRNVLVDPLGADDPGAHFDSHDLAQRLAAMLESRTAFHGLPDKFGLLVDAGGAIQLQGLVADIMVRHAGTGLRIDFAGGNAGLKLGPDAVIDAVGDTAIDAAIDAVDRLIAAFLRWQNSRAARRRMRDMVAAMGADDVFREAGLSGDPAAPTETPIGQTRAPVGFSPVARGGPGAFGLGAPFGRLDAGILKAAADLAGRYGDGTLRVTPWKSFLLWDVKPGDADEILRVAGRAGLVVDADDPRRRIVTCAGQPRCPSAHVDTQADAAFLAARLPGEGLVHLSGCAKGCAHPGAAALTLVAAGQGYGVVRDGCAADAPEIDGVALGDLPALLSRFMPGQKATA